MIILELVFIVVYIGIRYCLAVEQGKDQALKEYWVKIEGLEGADYENG